MKNFEINKRLNKLKNLLASTLSSTGGELGELELQSHWAKYICVLSAGFLEFALAQLYSEYTRSCSNSYVHSHVKQYIFKIQNPKSTKFIEIAKSFKVEWGADLQVFVEDEGRGEAIGNIMKNRHLIAHGKDSQITIVQIRNYLGKSVEVLKFIEKQCDLKYETTTV